MFFEKQGQLTGMCIAIPLNKDGWERLISGKLAESDLDATTIFDPERDEELGLHIYHIENFSTTRGFYKQALQGLADIVLQLQTTHSPLRVIGFSALAVTLSGIGLFYNKLNFSERSFINDEHIFIKDEKKLVIKDLSIRDLAEKSAAGYAYQNRCKMLVSYPNETSLVWTYFRR